MPFIDVFCFWQMFFLVLILLTRFFLYIYVINLVMKIQNKNFLASILFVLISFVCSAQVNEPPPPMPPPPPGLPIDNGLIALVVIALLYGVFKKIQRLKKLI